MDAFEEVIAAILQQKGYWTQTSVKVELTKAEKRKIGRDSSPRWELDVVAYRGKDNSIKVVECKSYLDSYGVDCAAFEGSNQSAQSRYKLFFEGRLRRVVFGRLKKQMVSRGFCRTSPRVQLCLAAGKIRGDEGFLRSHFEKNGWLLIGPDSIREELGKFIDSSYENSVAAIVTKLLLRRAKPIYRRRNIRKVV